MAVFIFLTSRQYILYIDLRSEEMVSDDMSGYPHESVS